MLELRDVTARYNGHRVLQGINLIVPDSTIVAVLGLNGVGKTTLLQVASGLLKPTRGQRLLDDTDTTDWPADRLARNGVCYVPEGGGFFPTLSVRENLLLMAPRKHSQPAIRQAFSAFPQLAKRQGHRAETLSREEQQMLALATVHTSRPEILLLDEATTGLSPRSVTDLFDHLKHLAQQGTALLVVEKYVERALRIADYVYVLDDGRLRQPLLSGVPTQLSPSGQMTWLLRSAREQDPDPVESPHEAADPHAGHPGWRELVSTVAGSVLGRAHSAR